MTREELTSQIEIIAKDIFDNAELKIYDSMSAKDVETWTSLSFMQFLTAIEEKYSFRFKMMELLKLKNMGSIIDSILNHIQ